MSRRGVRLVLLCEDDEHRRFARHAFLKLGFHSRELRSSVCPSGRGAADRWIRKQYPTEVRAHRRRASSQNVGLVVMIDADKRQVADRHSQLAEALEAEKHGPRGGTEPIVIWIPKRHIETWVAWLLRLKDHINENDDYKNLVRDADYRQPAARFVDLYRQRDTRALDILPAMATAFDELARLKP